jgi:hypothetical protein
MTDNEMMSALIAETERQLTLYGITDFEVSRGMQPTNQYAGADKDDPIKTRIFLHNVANPNHGRSREYTLDIASPTRTDTHHKGKIIQYSVLHHFDYKDPDAFTPEDMANLVQQLMDSPDAIKKLIESDIFQQEVSDVRPTFKVNDKDRNESMPTFDLTVNYNSSINKTAIIVDSLGHEIERI